MARGVDGRSIFEDDADRLRFMESLERAVREAKASLIAYCLMGNHFHLLVKVHRVPLSAILHKILTRYAMTFNMRHGRTGHLFQARYKSVVVLDERYLARLVAYIHENPVRAGLVIGAGNWTWSSAADYAGKRSGAPIDTINLSILLGETNGEESEVFDPWDSRGQSEPLLFRVPADDLMGTRLEACAAAAGHDEHYLRCRQRDAAHTDARRRFVAAAMHKGFTVTEIARWLGIRRGAVHHLAKKKFFNELAA